MATTPKPVGHSGVRVDVVERPSPSLGSGWIVVLAVVVIGALSLWQFIDGAARSELGDNTLPQVLLSALGLLVAGVVASMVTIVSPGDTKVVQFFGKYVGTLRKTGLRAVPPLSSRRTVSVKVRNFETNELKVNDADGNPVNIAAIVVWQVADTAKAVFAVEKFEKFIATQSESALRHVASVHPYDNAKPGQESLRGSTEQVAVELAQEVAARVGVAGLEVVEVRISSLAYAQEIAHAMLQRQQASAVIAAREQIVEGAVTMVESALARLEEDDVVELDEERKAAMVSNLLVVLCGSAQATPVVNTGTLYA
ncbi:MAG: SPFH domain-containing protein [Propionibacteriaceae bacterium]|jgi:hypothetical protein|nr:SPFH domain-containing protein [Propionibacteriaceae bacterium]